MKKLAVLITALLLATTLFTACSSKATTPEEPTATKASEEVTPITEIEEQVAEEAAQPEDLLAGITWEESPFPIIGDVGGDMGEAKIRNMYYAAHPDELVVVDEQRAESYEFMVFENPKTDEPNYRISFLGGDSVFFYAVTTNEEDIPYIASAQPLVSFFKESETEVDSYFRGTMGDVPFSGARFTSASGDPCVMVFISHEDVDYSIQLVATEEGFEAGAEAYSNLLNSFSF